MHTLGMGSDPSTPKEVHLTMMIDLRQVALTYQAPDGEVEALKDITLAVEDG